MAANNDSDLFNPLAIRLRMAEVEAERARARLMASHYAGLRLTTLAAPWKAQFKRLTARRDALKARLP